MTSLPDRSVTDSIREDFLTCHICFEIFTDARILPCLHTYCLRCITSHFDTAKADERPVVCPECRHPLLESVNSLKTNFFINGLTEVVKEKSTDNVSCTACHLRRINSKAKVKCLDCGDYLCSSCSDGHNASSLTWKHEKIPLDDIRQGTYDEKLRQLQKIKCQKHDDKDVEFYCESCSKSVCVTCVLLDHRDHKCKTVSEAVCARKSNIISLTEQLRTCLITFKTTERKVTSKFEALQKADNSKRLEIENQAQQEIAKINARKKTAIEKLASKTKVDQKKYEEKLENIQLQKRLVNSCINFSDNILKRGKDEEVLMLETVITERLIFLQNLHEGDISEDNGEKLLKLEVQHDSNQLTEPTADHTKEGLDTHDKVKEMDTDVIYCRIQSTTESKAYDSGEGKKNINMLPREPEITVGKSNVKVRFTKQNILSAKCGNDLKKPDIKDMVYSLTIGLIIADRCNSKLKVLSKTGSLKQEITSSGFQPFSVAVSGNIIGAISDNYLFLFTSTGTLKRKVQITKQKPNQSYYFTICLAGSGDRFVLGNIYGDRNISFYSQDGSFIRYLHCSPSLPLAYLSITPSGDIVLSEWGSGKLRVISPEGKVRFSVIEPLWKPNGTCVSKDGTIFVAEYHWKSVGVYSGAGDHLVDFKTSCDGVINPVCVAVDENENVYVTDNPGNICVYKVHKIQH